METHGQIDLDSLQALQRRAAENIELLCGGEMKWMKGPFATIYADLDNGVIVSINLIGQFEVYQPITS